MDLHSSFDSGSTRPPAVTPPGLKPDGSADGDAAGAVQASMETRYTATPKPAATRFTATPTSLRSSVEQAKIVVDKSLSRFVMTESNLFRKIWTLVITILLLYVGTMFIFRLSFVELRVEQAMSDEEVLESDRGDGSAPRDGWFVVDTIMNTLFWLDLLLNFFFSFEGAYREEICDFRICAMHYLKTSFVINLIACLPEDFGATVAHAVASNSPGASSLLSAALRLGRLQRLSRLTRLFRVVRMLKITANSQITVWFFNSKGPRVLKLFVGLLWVVHILACGWYLCAALHEEPMETWVARRKVDAAGVTSLIELPPFNQWLSAMYFVFTVFSTVGFGDMSVATAGEIIYVIFLIVVGIVFHSMIVSEAINILTAADQHKAFVDKHIGLISDFAGQTSTAPACTEDLQHWVNRNALDWYKETYSKDDMASLIRDRMMPPSLLDAIPGALFGGKLVQNRLFEVCSETCSRPPRFVALMSMNLVRCEYVRGDIVYPAAKFPSTMYLVLKGVFANVVDLVNRRGRTRDTHQSEDNDMSLRPYAVFAAGTYFGDIEILESCPRRATIRCETHEGELLALSRGALYSLISEFPEYTLQWVRRVKTREARRVRHLQRMKPNYDYADIAAATVQRIFRSAERKAPRSKRPPENVVVSKPGGDLLHEPGAHHSGGASPAPSLRLNDSKFAGGLAPRGELAAQLLEVRLFPGKLNDLTKKVDQLCSMMLERVDKQILFCKC